MGTVNSTPGNYYQLANLLSSGSGGSASSSALPTSTIETLVQALDAASSGSGSSQSGASSYLLDLSPEAQQLMNGTSSANGSGSNFVLTQAQQTAIENIIEQYKNAPFNQATFNAIQNALQAAGLSPQTLAAQDQINSFDPTDTLIDALNGDYSNIQNPATGAATEQTKESNYLQSIVSLWKADSATASSASGSSLSGSAAGV